MTDGRGLSFWGDENVLELVAIVTQPCEYAKTTELYTLNGYILRFANCISIENFGKKSSCFLDIFNTLVYQIVHLFMRPAYNFFYNVVFVLFQCQGSTTKNEVFSLFFIFPSFLILLNSL